MFSNRIGVTPVRIEIQRSDVDAILRNALYNQVVLSYLIDVDHHFHKTYSSLSNMLKEVWMDFFHLNIDEISSNTIAVLSGIKEYFKKSKWNEMYDLLEFIPQHYSDDEWTKVNYDFYNACNFILEKNLSAYRFINGYLTEITSNEEIESIEESLSATSSIKSVQTHLEASIELYSDRKSPDYRNSIKESISAVEALCKVITNDEKATLGKALAVIEKTHNIHPSLKSAFNSLYGYTSDSSGIRHALTDESNLGQEDAKFVLVTCSAFINFLMVKISN